MTKETLSRGVDLSNRIDKLTAELQTWEKDGLLELHESRLADVAPEAIEAFKDSARKGIQAELDKAQSEFEKL